ncbi:uncharacterized protein LOC107461000 [Arachis duranensis]|uniref:Uncharacterized protein LOC107461000 n=1 Tax=Arachis duranensis TaxID=130453 RepID=A0A6P4BTE3_ARADU|nr:uncharacterized protein LOC107461000 [Arachis duranensis]
MSWNVRGAASCAFRRTLKEFLRQYNPDIVILLETKVSGNNARRIIQGAGFNNFIIEEAQGFIGGIWICWKDNSISITTLESNKQFIHTRVQRHNQDPWCLTAVYASPQPNNRRVIWQSIERIARNIGEPWLLIGDFNEIKDGTEKKGGRPINLRMCRNFANWIDRCGLVDLGFIGTRFTWRGPQWEGYDRVFKRLDRALSNPLWRTKFQEAVVKVLPRTNSDHHPLLLMENEGTDCRNGRPFRFEAMWSMHPDFRPFLEKHWKEDSMFIQNLNSLRKDLSKWNKEVFGNIFKTKRRLLNRINGIQKSISYGKNPFFG